MSSLLSASLDCDVAKGKAAFASAAFYPDLNAGSFRATIKPMQQSSASWLGFLYKVLAKL